MPIGVKFENLTNPSRISNLYVGDKWKLTITTYANTRVDVYGGKLGENHQNALGMTDMQGRLVKTGTITQAELGQWSQQFSVINPQTGGADSAGLAFVVTNPPSSNESEGAGNNKNDTPPAPNTNPFGFISDLASGVPSWVWVAAGGFLLYNYFASDGE